MRGFGPSSGTVGGDGRGLTARETVGLGALQLFAPREEEDAPSALGLLFSPAGYVAQCALWMLLVSGLWLPFHWARYALPTLVLLPAFYVAAASLAVELAARRTPRRALADPLLFAEEGS